MNPLGRIWLGALLCVACAASAQAAVIYAVDGDSDIAFILDTDAETVSSFSTSAVGIGYVIAVRDTIMLGDRDDGGSVEYELDGTPTGNSYSGGSNFSELLDGTTDGVNNYGVECCGSTNSVTIADATWENQAVLFDLPSNDDGMGITFDSASGSLWVAIRPGNEIRNYSLSGTLLSSFTAATNSTACCLAYDPEDDTIWVGSNGYNQLLQYSKAGTLLDTVTIDDWNPSNQWGAEIAGITQVGSTALFKVTKEFTDGSDDEVDVTLTCNSGLPLTQSFTIAGGDPDGVTFVVTELPEDGANCEITESGGPDNYTPFMNDGAGCEWTGVRNGLRTCEIVNVPDPAEYTVEKDWIVPAAGYEEMSYVVDVMVSCDSDILEVNGSSYSGGSSWTGYLDDGEDAVLTVDTTGGSTSCSAEEYITQSGVEGTASAACGGADLDAGDSATCTFTNTVFFEGIPTLSQYGLALMALLMLGVGFIGFRRFV